MRSTYTAFFTATCLCASACGGSSANIHASNSCTPWGPIDPNIGGTCCAGGNPDDDCCATAGTAGDPVGAYCCDGAGVDLNGICCGNGNPSCQPICKLDGDCAGYASKIN